MRSISLTVLGQENTTLIPHLHDSETIPVLISAKRLITFLFVVPLVHKQLRFDRCVRIALSYRTPGHWQVSVSRRSAPFVHPAPSVGK